MILTILVSIAKARVPATLLEGMIIVVVSVDVVVVQVVLIVSEHCGGLVLVGHLLSLRERKVHSGVLSSH